MSANLISAVHDLVLESGLGAKNIAAAVGKQLLRIGHKAQTVVDQDPGLPFGQTVFHPAA